MIKDFLGKEINVGDYICYPTTQSSSITMNIGQVIEIVNREVYYNHFVEVPKVRWVRDNSRNQEWSQKWRKTREVWLSKTDHLLKLEDFVE